MGLGWRRMAHAAIRSGALAIVTHFAESGWDQAVQAIAFTISQSGLSSTSIRYTITCSRVQSHRPVDRFRNMGQRRRSHEHVSLRRALSVYVDLRSTRSSSPVPSRHLPTITRFGRRSSIHRGPPSCLVTIRTLYVILRPGKTHRIWVIEAQGGSKTIGSPQAVTRLSCLVSLATKSYRLRSNR